MIVLQLNLVKLHVSLSLCMDSAPKRGITF
jgi:hypothetical protein